MSGFFGWFLVIIGVLAVFNAEKLPALRQMMEEKFKDSVDAAKEGAKIAKCKIEKAKSEVEARKNAPHAEVDAEENTPEETAEALRFMSSYINKEKTPQAPQTPKVEQVVENAPQPENESAEDKPIDLEHRY